jgi:hypothetical protein
VSNLLAYLPRSADDYEVPNLIATAVMTTFAILFYDSSGPRNHGMANPPRAGPFGVLMYSIFWMIVTLPAMIISYR